MFAFLKPKHLRYGSIEEWIDREGISLGADSSRSTLDANFKRLEELRRHLWLQHFNQLSDEEQELLEDGEHPSQSHSRATQAEAILDEFRCSISDLDYVDRVELGSYHCDRLIICVTLRHDVGYGVYRSDIPTFYRGFEVKIYPDAPTKPVEPTG